MAGNSRILNKREAAEAQQTVTRLRKAAAEIRNTLPAFQRLIAARGWHASDADYPQWRLDILAEFERLGFYQGVFGDKSRGGAAFGNMDAIHHEYRQVHDCLQTMRAWLADEAQTPWGKGYKVARFRTRPGFRAPEALKLTA